MSALTNPSRVPIHSLYIGTSFCTTSATATVGGGAAFGADPALEQPAPVSNTTTIRIVIVISKCFIVNSSVECMYRGRLVQLAAFECVENAQVTQSIHAACPAKLTNSGRSAPDLSPKGAKHQENVLLKRPLCS